MKTMNRQPTLIAMALGLTLGTTVAYTPAYAEYDTDYEISSVYDAAVKNIPYSASASVSRGGGYRTEILLDEAYHEYQSGEIATYEADLVDLEQTEIAAFEASEPSTLPSVIPWQLSGALD